MVSREIPVGMAEKSTSSIVPLMRSPFSFLFFFFSLFSLFSLLFVVGRWSVAGRSLVGRWSFLKIIF